MIGSDSKTMYFEDFPLGFVIKGETSRPILAHQITQFAILSGDMNPIHIDAARAEQSQFGSIVAHGMLCLSAATGLAWDTGLAKRCKEIVFREIRSWEFKHPVLPGDILRIEMTVKETDFKRRLNMGKVSFDVLVFNQRGEIVNLGIWVFVIPGCPKSQDPVISSAIVNTPAATPK